MSQKSPRSKPIADVHVDKYYDLFERFAAEVPLCSVECRFGPRMVKDSRAVTPESLCRIRGLLEPIVSTAGVVIHGARFEEAVGRFHGTRTDLVGTASPSLPTLITSHTMAHLSLARSLVHEDDVNDIGGRRYPKTGGWQRLANSTYWTTLGPLFALIRAAFFPSPARRPWPTLLPRVALLRWQALLPRSCLRSQLSLRTRRRSLPMSNLMRTDGHRRFAVPWVKLNRIRPDRVHLQH